jgi:hypothetical protein
MYKYIYRQQNKLEHKKPSVNLPGTLRFFLTNELATNSFQLSRRKRVDRGQVPLQPNM